MDPKTLRIIAGAVGVVALLVAIGFIRPGHQPPVQLERPFIDTPQFATEVVFRGPKILLTETIVQNLCPKPPCFGFTRALPKIVVDSSGGEHRATVDLSVALRSSGGQPQPIMFSIDDRYPRFRRFELLNPEVELTPGLYTYTLQYELSGAVAELADRDEFVWDSTGNWRRPIQQFSITLKLPKRSNPAEIVSVVQVKDGTNWNIMTPALGTGEALMPVFHDERTLEFRSPRAIQPTERIITIVRAPKGVLTGR